MWLPPKLTDNVCDRIKQLREAMKWTQEEFAEELGISRSFLALIERRHRLPSWKTYTAVVELGTKKYGKKKLVKLWSNGMHPKKKKSAKT